ncbi:amidohydrolase family protein [Paraglaciecola aquimarina]|uniref:Amidohydrolase family protein n=1 Tax=Paraglaciecola algarum TaxID=3050085 RepID=A0ABS9D3G9_9ALTE|nr:amidohydrolase family protein [Paraglaciecola sp. G1-23]MCF2946982.1 amidohydrolase family protein [Paraglaciecola sp. G1-23]
MFYLIQNALGVFLPSHLTSQLGETCDIRISNGVITEVGHNLLATSNEQVIDAKNCVVYPGLINTHHHIAQTVLKAIPEGLDDNLGEWLANVPYRFWPHIEPKLMYYAAVLGFSELLRSGATTCCDHHYLYHESVTQELEDVVWQAAEDVGIRLVLCRGGATHAGSHRGLKGSNIVPESIEQMITRLEHSFDRYHQDQVNPMRRLVVAPTSLIHSSTSDDLKLLAEFARSHKLKMHSHLLEVEFDQIQAKDKYGLSAVEYAQSCNWLGEDVWFAHLVKANQQDIQLLADTGTSISHCPTSNCRLGSGVAPVIPMYSAGMNVTLGVDGSASSESGSMIQELNLTWLLHRSLHGPKATQVDQVINWASKNGANLLGLDNLGVIEIGKAADLVLYDLSDYRYWGNHSPIYAPVMAGEPVKIKASIINGKQVVDNGQINGLDLGEIRQNLKVAMQQLLTKAS